MREGVSILFLVVIIAIGWNQSYRAHLDSIFGIAPPATPAPTPPDAKRPERPAPPAAKPAQPPRP